MSALERDRFAGPWFDSRTAAAYIPCASLKAFYEWRKRHGLIARSNGSVAKADLDRVLKRRKPRRVMHSASLANLRKRRRVEPTAETASMAGPGRGTAGAPERA